MWTVTVATMDSEVVEESLLVDSLVLVVSRIDQPSCTNVLP